MVGRDLASVAPMLPADTGLGFRGKSFGELSARRVNLHRYRCMFPARWAEFLRANFPSNVEAAAFFDCDEATIRNWKACKSAPRGEYVALAASEHEGLTAYLLGVAA